MPPQIIAETTSEVKVPSSNHKFLAKLPKLHLPFDSKTIVIFLLVIGAGIPSGYLLARKTQASSRTAPGAIQTKNEVGIKDEKTFPDCAQGVLESNDISNSQTEGSHKLIREGGPSQTLYMTSSVLAMDDYIGKKVEVCGQTLKSKKVAWFMDVGKLKLLE